MAFFRLKDVCSGKHGRAIYVKYRPLSLLVGFCISRGELKKLFVLLSGARSQCNRRVVIVDIIVLYIGGARTNRVIIVRASATRAWHFSG